MWDLLQALYCTYHGPNPLNCASVAKDFRRHSTVGTGSWYLLTQVPLVPSVEHCKREQYSSITGGNIRVYLARCVRYASVGSLPPF